MKKTVSVLLSVIIAMLSCGAVSAAPDEGADNYAEEMIITEDKDTETLYSDTYEYSDDEDEYEDEADPLVSEADPSVSEADPLVSEADPSVSEADPSVSEANPLVSEADPSVSEADPSVSEANPLVSEAYDGSSDEWFDNPFYVNGQFDEAYFNEVYGIEDAGSEPEEMPAYEDDEDDEGITVYLDGKYLDLKGDPVIVNERVLVPMRSLFEAFGAEVGWDNDTRTAMATYNGVSIEIAIGDDKMYRNGAVISLDAPAMISQENTMIPVRAVAESFNCRVGWDAARRRVDLQR